MLQKKCIDYSETALFDKTKKYNPRIRSGGKTYLHESSTKVPKQKQAKTTLKPV